MLSSLLVLTALLVGLAPAAAQAIPALFAERSDLADAQVLRLDATEARARLLTVDPAVLFGADGKALDAASLPAIALNPFPDVAYIGEVAAVEKNGLGTTWTGTLRGVENGTFFIVVVDGALIAHIASPEGVYEVSRIGDDLYRAIELDQSFPAEDAPGEFAPAGKVLAAGALGSRADSGATIDIMVLYTSSARAAEGSTAAMLARVALAVSETNSAYASSGVTPRLRLVHAEEVAYAETGNISTDVNRLAGTTDGFLDYIHSIRNIYAADMVSLIVENGGGYCGMAKAIMATAASAFQVTARAGCMTGYYTFGHEFGHLQGARHDVYVDSSSTPYSYGHGWVNPTDQWRTVMAYNDRCSDFGFNCTRLRYFSNPTKFYGGDPMGNTQAQVYLVLNNTAFTVANFRSAVIATYFSSSFNGSASNWFLNPAIGAAWYVNSANLFSTGAASKFASMYYNATFGDVTYQARMFRSGGTASASFSNYLIIRGNPALIAADGRWRPAYRFQYTNTGYFSVWEDYSGGTSGYLRNWTAHSAIVKNGWNTLKVVANGQLLKFYINNVLVWVGYDSTLRTGKVGVGFYRAAASAGTLYVDWASASTTPTAADVAGDLVPGIVVGGGNSGKSP